MNKDVDTEIHKWHEWIPCQFPDPKSLNLSVCILWFSYFLEFRT